MDMCLLIEGKVLHYILRCTRASAQQQQIQQLEIIPNCCRVLRDCRLHPYHYQRAQDLQPEDYGSSKAIHPVFPVSEGKRHTSPNTDCSQMRLISGEMVCPICITITIGM